MIELKKLFVDGDPSSGDYYVPDLGLTVAPTNDPTNAPDALLTPGVWKQYPVPQTATAAWDLIIFHIKIEGLSDSGNTGAIYFDDVLANVGAVPEPASCGILAATAPSGSSPSAKGISPNRLPKVRPVASLNSRTRKRGGEIDKQADRWIGDNVWLLIALNAYERASGDHKYDEMRSGIAKWLAKPALLVVALFQLMGTWNDFRGLQRLSQDARGRRAGHRHRRDAQRASRGAVHRRVKGRLSRAG